jgi:hypothetical protein
MLPLAIQAPDLFLARAAAAAFHSTPNRARSGRRSRKIARNPPVPQPASRTLPRVRLRASQSRAWRARYHHIRSSAASMSAYSPRSMVYGRPLDNLTVIAAGTASVTGTPIELLCLTSFISQQLNHGIVGHVGACECLPDPVCQHEMQCAVAHFLVAAHVADQRGR